MATRTRFGIGAILLLLLMTPPHAGAQTAAARPAAEKSGATILLNKGIRAENPLMKTPDYAALTPGLYARPVVEAASPQGDYSVRVWALLLSPGAHTRESGLPGAVVLLLRSGHAVVIVAGKETRLELGDSMLAPEGASLQFINPDPARPAQLRAVLLSGSR
jgi:hypothetical protein